MFNQQTIALLVQVILIISALNWGLVSYNGMDFVNVATGGGDIEKYVKYAIAAVAVYSSYQVYMAIAK